MTATLDQLEAVIPQLSERDRSFAADLVAKGRKYGLSDKQAYWVDTLHSRATKPVVRETHQVGDLSNILKLFDKAAEHLKRPAICLPAPGSYTPGSTKHDGRWIKISVAGAGARVPGSLNVATKAPFGEGTWFGRIKRDGTFEKSFKADLPEGLVTLLQAFASDPAAVAGAFGKLTGHCVFCSRSLEDERSTDVGYGPVCAKRYGLRWGGKATAQDDGPDHITRGEIATGTQ